MRKFAKIYLAIGLLMALTMCAKEEAASVDIETVENPMRFGIEQIVETKVEYSEQENGGRSAKFEPGDQIGLYAYYNNFYYYYDKYSSFAESVLFSNNGLEVGADGESLSYTPLMSWTFSTVYGTAPYKIDCVAYYPFREEYNEDFVDMTNDTKGDVTLVYAYAYDQTDGTTTVNYSSDFMIAHTTYQGEADTENTAAADFRTDMLALDKIKFSFERQMASMNFQITKPDDYANEIVVTGLTVHFYAPTEFSYNVNNKEGVWSSMSTDYELYASRTWSEGEEPAITKANIADLLTDDEVLYFPPGTDIWKVVFTIKIDDGEEQYYTWHAHVPEMEANTHYTLAFELDPDRAN